MKNDNIYIWIEFLIIVIQCKKLLYLQVVDLLIFVQLMQAVLNLIIWKFRMQKYSIRQMLKWPPPPPYTNTQKKVIWIIFTVTLDYKIFLRFCSKKKYILMFIFKWALKNKTKQKSPLKKKQLFKRIKVVWKYNRKKRLKKLHVLKYKIYFLN